MKKSGLLFLVLALCFSCTKKTAELTNRTELFVGKNILIDKAIGGLGACEPSIVISPANPNIVVAGSILNRVYRSEDGGATWEKSFLKSSSGVYGDPVVDADYKGNFYYAHLSNPTGKAWVDDEFLDRIVVQKSGDEGKTWTDGSYPAPNPPKDQDKEWLAIDPITNDVVMCWTEFDKYGSKDEKDKSRILFSRMKYGQDTWSKPISISDQEGDCIDDDKTTEGAVPSIGPNGEVYVTWSYNDGLYFDKSMDGGKTWMKEDLKIANQPKGWAIDIPGINRCNGMPITRVDISDGPNKGTIYVNWSDQRNGKDDTDIWMIKSTNQGKTWSNPKRVNDDLPGKHQFFTWMDVDPITGYVYVVFYDRRAYDDTQTDVYLAYSKDGGNSFENVKISEKPFVPNPAVFFGDYNDISAYNGIVRPIWTRLHESNLSVWTVLVEDR